MPNTLTWPAPLAEMAPEQRSFTLALVASLLVHAVVLSIHFQLPSLLDRATEHALDVILVNNKSRHKPRDIQAKAQANLDGGGNTEEDRRAATPLPPSAKERPGDDLLDAQQRVTQLESQTRQMMTRLRSERTVSSDPSRNEQAPPAQPTISGLDLASSAREMVRLEGQISKQYDDYNKRPRKKFIGARTEEYKPAQYIEDWRNKIERIGNLNYPEAARGRLYGSLVVYIEIKSSGELERVEVQRSSGHRVLDEAAVRIVRLAAPYAPFPPEMREQFDILAFARTWTFTTSDRLQSE